MQLLDALRRERAAILQKDVDALLDAGNTCTDLLCFLIGISVLHCSNDIFFELRKVL